MKGSAEWTLSNEQQTDNFKNGTDCLTFTLYNSVSQIHQDGVPAAPPPSLCVVSFLPGGKIWLSEAPEKLEPGGAGGRAWRPLCESLCFKWQETEALSALGVFRDL